MALDTHDGCLVADTVSLEIDWLGDDLKLVGTNCLPIFTMESPSFEEAILCELDSQLAPRPMQASSQPGHVLVAANTSERGWNLVFEQEGQFELQTPTRVIRKRGRFVGMWLAPTRADQLTVAYETPDGSLRLLKCDSNADDVLLLPDAVTAVFYCFASSRENVHAIVEIDDLRPSFLCKTLGGDWIDVGEPVLSDTVVTHFRNCTYWWELSEGKLLLQSLELGKTTCQNILVLDGMALEPSPRGPGFSTDGRYLIACVFSLQMCKPLIYLVDLQTGETLSLVVEGTYVRNLALLSNISKLPSV